MYHLNKVSHDIHFVKYGRDAECIACVQHGMNLHFYKLAYEGTFNYCVTEGFVYNLNMKSPPPNNRSNLQIKTELCTWINLQYQIRWQEDI